jgi:hypothetical protein
MPNFLDFVRKRRQTPALRTTVVGDGYYMETPRVQRCRSAPTIVSAVIPTSTVNDRRPAQIGLAVNSTISPMRAGFLKSTLSQEAVTNGTRPKRLAAMKAIRSIKARPAPPNSVP